MIAEGPASLQLVLSAGIQIADGLSAAHQLGIFHRDLKPANVMLTDGGLIKILDFGLARQAEPATRRTSTRRLRARRTPPPPEATYTARGGTIAYMAPEQFVTGRSSVQSDVFALGLILYELASGRHPFHRPDAPEFQTIRATQFADPPNLREIVPELPVELESVILRCLEKQPSARFSLGRGCARRAADDHEGAAAGLGGHAGRFDLAAAGAGPAGAGDRRRKRSARPASCRCWPSGFASRATTATAKQNSIVVLPFINFGDCRRERIGDRACAAVRLCAGGCDCGAAGTDDVAGGAAFEFADVDSGAAA